MIGIILTLLLAVILGLFALANPQTVDLALWPRGLVAQMTLWQAILLPAAVAFLAGALVAWGASLRQQRRLRQMEQAATLLEAELAAREHPKRA